MDGMFRDCTSLKALDLSGFDTANVTNTENIFLGCTSLENITVSDKRTPGDPKAMITHKG